MARPLTRVARATRALPRAVGQRRRAGQQRLGRRGVAHDERQAAAGQRPAPRRPPAGRLLPDRPALPDRRRLLSLRRDGVQLGRLPRHRDRPQQHIAWGMTNLPADTTDLYLEKVTGKDYLYDDRELPLEERDERIRIDGGDSKLITVRSTRHGPLRLRRLPRAVQRRVPTHRRRRGDPTGATATRSRSTGPRRPRAPLRTPCWR